ncbi:DUF6755 family protein [Phycisphaerales bacterium AB-hyl4]|uniref:DUF6755 family protein n=1 Tax=Natronomicrosphaera hydrolytica TaxID=3242702 RepID=A0ABV4U8A3_9BACT
MNHRQTTSPPSAQRRQPLSREQRMTVLYGILCFVLTLVVVQLWLLTATMHAYLGGDMSLIIPAGLASVICLALNLGLLRYLYALERP